MGKRRHTNICIPAAKGALTPVNAVLRQEQSTAVRKPVEWIWQLLQEAFAVTDSRRTIIYGIHRRIRGRLLKNVNGRCRGHGTHCMEKRMESWSKIITDNTEEPKRHAINFRLIDDRLIIGVCCTGCSGGTPNKQKCVHVLRQHTTSCIDKKMSSKRSKATGRLLRALALRQHSRQTSTLATLHISVILNDLSEIPSRSFGHKNKWHFKSDK